MIDLLSIPTLVYTIPRNTVRQERVTVYLNNDGFTNWKFFMGGTGKPYWEHIYQEHAGILATEKAPLLILEDDIEPVNHHATIEPPADYPIVYLGGGRGGNPRGNAYARQNLPGAEIIPSGYTYSYTPIDDTWMRIYGMWYTHAILYLDTAVMRQVSDTLLRGGQPIDTTLAKNQWRWKVACLKRPMWWQNDGHHFDTRNYSPLPFHPVPIQQQASKRRGARRKALGDGCC